MLWGSHRCYPKKNMVGVETRQATCSFQWTLFMVFYSKVGRVSWIWDQLHCKYGGVEWIWRTGSLNPSNHWKGSPTSTGFIFAKYYECAVSGDKKLAGIPRLRSNLQLHSVKRSYLPLSYCRRFRLVKLHQAFETLFRSLDHCPNKRSKWIEEPKNYSRHRGKERLVARCSKQFGESALIRQDTKKAGVGSIF